MQILDNPKLKLNSDALGFINLYKSLGERADNFLPDRIYEILTNFVRLCFEEPDDPARQLSEINQKLLELKEAIPGYVDVSLMIFPHENSKAYEYSSRRQAFTGRLTHLMNIELIDEKEKQQVQNILKTHDFSIGTPPVTQAAIDFLYKILLGDDVNELRKFRDIIGIKGNVEEAQWNYLLDVLDQMVIQSTHYTTTAEKNAFLSRTESTINFKGLNGFIRTLVSGGAETVVKLIVDEIFSKEMVRIIEFGDADEVYEQIKEDSTSIFLVKTKHMRSNPFNDVKWFPLLTRIIFIDDSPESRISNTSLVFAFHNDIINTLNKVHNKKLGAPANTQLNLRLILEKVNCKNITKFRIAAEEKIKDYEKELRQLKVEQLADADNPAQDIILYKFDEFARQVIKDKYILSKFAAFLYFIEQITDIKTQPEVNKQLLEEFEIRMRQYFYQGSSDIHISTIVEGGGRNQIRTYGEYLLQKHTKPINVDIIERCRVILDILPDNYERTLHNHFHKNFGVNLFLEKYKEYLTKVENEANNKGRFRNLLIDLEIDEKYDKLPKSGQKIIKEFISGLGNLEKTSISDDAQMIIRDVVLNEEGLKPFIFLNQQAAWEYKDLLPIEKFDINPFDIEIELDDEGRIDYERFLIKLDRLKSSFQLFDETGAVWDHFCANSTILINDPSNPTGFTDFNDVSLIKFLKFISNTQFTIFLDEAYNDSVKIENIEEPKWRTISNYIINNIATYARISMVAALSTTKNLGATGDRLGALAVTDAKLDVIDYIEKHKDISVGNSNSLYLLINILEVAQQARKIKHEIDESLPKDASRHKVKKKLENFIEKQIKSNQPAKLANKKKNVKRESLFEGSPLHIFLLDELVSLDKLDVLELPDDFKYKGEAFFSYYKRHIVADLNRFRINRIFRFESNKRLTLAKKIADQVIKENNVEKAVTYLDSDGAYLFNIVLKDFVSFLDLEKFTKKLAEERGLAAIPYPTGFVRFSLGGYIEGNDISYHVFENELKTALEIFFKYWFKYFKLKTSESNDAETDDLLAEIFNCSSDEDFVSQVLSDYSLIKEMRKQTIQSLRINQIKTLYHPFPIACGVSINSIRDSKNAVFEFYENIGQCSDLIEFINSQAFSKVYENLLPQIYRNIPAISALDINEVLAQFGKSAILKYISSKIDFQPDAHLLDEPDERLIMIEILIELERILFSDHKVKLLALNSNEKDAAGDLAKLEGYNIILRKYIKELLLHFNLPFEQELKEPSLEELFNKALELFEETTDKYLSELNIDIAIERLIDNIADNETVQNHPFGEKICGYYYVDLKNRILNGALSYKEKLLNIYLLETEDLLSQRLLDMANKLQKQLEEHEEQDTKLFTEYFLPQMMRDVYPVVFQRRYHKINEANIPICSRRVVLFFTNMMNLSKQTDYYFRYNHILIRLLNLQFLPQNSSFNEMIQHGFTIYREFTNRNNILETYESGKLKWINDLMRKCGVIAAEQPVQTHTRISTDAKKREYPFHKLNHIETVKLKSNHKGQSPREFIKNMSTRPASEFFAARLAKFVDNLDEDDYRCHIVNQGLVNELYIFQKAYLKYLTDNFRLIQPQAVSLKEIKEFVPDIILFLGAPEKVLSYPQIGYFDIKGPNGNIKTFITPLKKSVDYFGDVKKPRLTMLNEKVKEMGGAPVHGSFFILEGEDGSLFGIMISGDSGVGKSEMLAAMMLKWLRKDLPGVRSIKLVAGDMLHIFPDTEGNLYGIGTEIGDFSRVTDFDPQYIKAYRTLFESSADSNVTDLNSRSTISGFCDIHMPFKIDIILTAQNSAKQEAGITKYSNVENFMLYRDSHGERKEKATSSDNPNFQRTLLRYTADKNIVEVLDKHGNYLDSVLDWDKDYTTGIYYLASSYKMIDKIDIEEVVNKIFKDKEFVKNNFRYAVKDVKFDIIKNRFTAQAVELGNEENEIRFNIDRPFFSLIFNSLASTPAGNPFIDEASEREIKHHLINVLKGGATGKGKGKNIQCAILSTDLGKPGKEISGPQKAAAELVNLIQEVRNTTPELYRIKNIVKKSIDEHYGWLFKHYKKSIEVERYNFFLYQMNEMRKARLVRLDDLKTPVDMARLKNYVKLPKNHPFSPLLVTPIVNIELNNISETYEQLMWLPNNLEFADRFYEDCEKVYIANGYSEETIINNMIVQLLLMNGYILVEDLSRGKLTEKANRETIAAAKYAAIRKLKNR